MKRIMIFINAILLICTVLTIFGLIFYFSFQMFNAFVYKTSSCFKTQVYMFFSPNLIDNLLTAFPSLNIIIKTIFVLAFTDCVKGFIKKGKNIVLEDIYFIGCPLIVGTMIAKIIMFLK